MGTESKRIEDVLQGLRQRVATERDDAEAWSARFGARGVATTECEHYAQGMEDAITAVEAMLVARKNKLFRCDECGAGFSDPTLEGACPRCKSLSIESNETNPIQSVVDGLQKERVMPAHEAALNEVI